MQTKRDRQTIEMMLLPPLESFIPEDHYFRRLDKVMDLGFVHEAVRDRYCQDNGRPSIDPEAVCGVRNPFLTHIKELEH